MLVLAALLLAVVASSVSALPAFSTETTYYKDANYKVAVGFRVLYCNGSVYTEGQVTPYRRTTIVESCNGCDPDWPYCDPI
jgi:hypothetical protein